MKKLSIIALLSTLGFSASFSVMPYLSYIDYSKKASKDNAYLEGIYFSAFDSPYKFEIDAENLLIKYKGTIPDWRQQDLTLVGHYYQGYNYDYKLGAHQTFVDDGYSTYTESTFILGFLYYKYLKHNVGLDYYYADYHGIKVNEGVLKGGVNFGNYYSKIGSFYAEMALNYIAIDGGSVPKDNYFNADLKLQHFKGPWTTTLKASIGKFAYKIANGGFIIYNTSSEYKYEAGLKINYALKKTDSVAFSYTNSEYNNGLNNVYSNTYVISYAHAF